MDKKNVNIMTPEFRVSFPSVFRTAKPVQEGGKAKYSITMLFKPGEPLTQLKAAATKLLVEKLGPDQSTWPRGIRSPFKDQGEKDYEGYVKGSLCLTATSDQRPGLVDQNAVDIIEERDFYPGCWARATLRPFYYEVKNSSGGVMNRGLGFGLQNIQKLRDDSPLGGRMRASDEFEPVAPAEGETPTAAAVFA